MLGLKLIHVSKRDKGVIFTIVLTMTGYRPLVSHILYIMFGCHMLSYVALP